MARVLRKLNRFDDAELAYEEAAGRAEAIEDSHSQLLSRIGRANTLTARGNLLESEQSLRGILVDAQLAAHRDAEALAHQGLAVVLSTSGRSGEAIPHEWRAYQLHEDEPARMRTLSDLGVMLLMIGDADGAERALTEIVQRGASRDVIQNAMIELMNCASFRGDRLGFERWRERCEARRKDMPPNILVDFLLKAAIGRARFGQFDRADDLLANALRTAEQAGLHEFVFRVERIGNGLHGCEADCTSIAAAESESRTDALREVSRGLALLGR